MGNSVHPEPVEDPYEFKPLSWILDTPGYITPREYVRMASTPAFIRRWVENRLEPVPLNWVSKTPGTRLRYCPPILRVRQPAQLLLDLEKDLQSGDFYVSRDSDFFPTMPPFSLNIRTLAKDRKLRRDKWLEKDLEVVRYLQEQVLYGYILSFISRSTAIVDHLPHDTGELS